MLTTLLLARRFRPTQNSLPAGKTSKLSGGFTSLPVRLQPPHIC
jgi:hypothetical protein